MSAVIVVVLLLSTCHLLLGVISVCVGITSSIKAEVRLDQHVSPIWSGVMFIISWILGYICAKTRTAYPMIWFTASNVGSLVAAIVSIQMLYRWKSRRRDGDNTSLADATDTLPVVALGVAGCECFVCIASFIVSCRMAKTNKKQLQLQRDNSHQTQEGSDAGQENASDYNEEFYPTCSGPPLPDVPEQERFPSVQTENDPNDFFLSWNLTKDASLRAGSCFNLEFNADSNQCSVCTTTRLHDDVTRGLRPVARVGGEMLQNRHDGDQSPDQVTIYAISSDVNLDHADPSDDESPANNHNVAIHARNEPFPGGEKPRLKRIISLRESECGAFTHNNTT